MMYSKSKNVGTPSDAQSKEKLAMYVYEYLVHIGAQKTANSFLQEIRWDKSISVSEPPGFLHSWWSAAPERRDTHEHSSEAKAFHDYGFVNSGYPNGLPHPNHPVMSGPGGVSGPGGGPGMPPPLGPPGPDSVSMRQRPSGPPMMSGNIPGSGPGIQAPSHHPSIRFHQPNAGGYPGIPVGSGMIPPHANLIPSSGPPHPMHGNPMMPHHHHPPGAIVGHPRPRWIGPSMSQQQGQPGGCPPCPPQQGGGGIPVVCSGSAGPNSVSSTGPGSTGPGSCGGGGGIVPSPGHPGTPNQHPSHIAVPSPLNNQSSDHSSGGAMPGHPHHPTPPHYIGGQQPPQQQTPPSSSNTCMPPEYGTRPSPHLVFTGGGGPGSTPDNGMFGSGPGCGDSGLLNGSIGPPRSSGMMPPPPPDYSGGMSSSSNPYPPGSDMKASPLHGGPNMGCDMMSPAGGPPSLMPSEYPPGNGPNNSGFSGVSGESVMMMPPPSQGNMIQPQHMNSVGPPGQAPPPPQYVPSGAQHPGSGGPPSSMQSICSGSNPSPAGGLGSVQFPYFLDLD